VHVDGDELHVLGEALDVGPWRLRMRERGRRGEEGVEELGVRDKEGAEEGLERRLAVCAAPSTYYLAP